MGITVVLSWSAIYGFMLEMDVLATKVAALAFRPLVVSVPKSPSLGPALQVVQRQ